MNCPYCGSSKVWKKSFVASVKYGKRQRYACADCGHTFYYAPPRPKPTRKAKKVEKTKAKKPRTKKAKS